MTDDTIPALARALGIREETPFEEGASAAKRAFSTWFDCPYSPSKIDEREAYREWMAGWNSIKRGSLP